MDSSVQADALATVHKVPVGELVRSLESDATVGLKSSTAAARMQDVGTNDLVVPRESLVLKALRYLFGGFGSILWICAVLSFLSWRPLGDPNPQDANLALSIVIAVVALVQSGFYAWQESRSSKLMATMLKTTPGLVECIRNGTQHGIPVSELVPGDIVRLSAGVRVPADLRLISTNHLLLDNSSLTGESEPVQATIVATNENFMQSRNMVFFGCSVVEGTGMGVVVATGNRTVMGKIAILASQKSSSSPIQKEVNRFVIIIAAIALCTCIVLIMMWSAWLNSSYPGFLPKSVFVVTLVGVAIAFVPVGLPLSFSLTLTAVARRMLQNCVLVRNLGCVETLGNVNLIASDKTGTLTQNKMSVSFLVDGAGRVITDRAQMHHELSSSSCSPLKELLMSLALCNQAEIVHTVVNGPSLTKQAQIAGNSSDAAILAFCDEIIPVSDVRKAMKKVAEIPFNSRNKWMLSVHTVSGPLRDDGRKMSTDDGAGSLPRCIMIMKGAAEMLLERCTKMLVSADDIVTLSADEEKVESLSASSEWEATGYLLDQDGCAGRLSPCGTGIDLSDMYLSEATPAAVENIRRIIQRFANQGQRVMAVCSRPLVLPVGFAPGGELDAENLPRNDMCFIGLVGLVDLPRPEVADVIAKCRAAGIKTMMVTGDHPDTAAAIASKVGVFTPDGTAVADGGPTPCSGDVPSFDTMQDFASSTDTNHRRHVVVTGQDVSIMLPCHWHWVFAHEEIVFARTTPEQKLRVVQEAQQLRYTVAVTGDGTNDSPALRQADIGVCMGSGSDVAREASDIVLLDDNFGSLVVGIELGRLVFENLKKVVLYLLPAGSCAELIPVLVNVILGVPLPLSSLLMIVVCVGTDLAPSLSLVHEHAEANLMNRHPRERDKSHLVDAKLMMDAYFFKGMLIAVAAHFMYFWYMYSYGGFLPADLFLAYNQWDDGFHGYSLDQLNEFLFTAQCVYFICMVEMQFGNLLSTRTRFLSIFKSNPFSGPARNLRLFAGMSVSMVLVVLLLFLPFCNAVFQTRPPPALFWFVPFAFSLCLVALDEARKFLIRRYPRGLLAKIAW